MSRYRRCTGDGRVSTGLRLSNSERNSVLRTSQRNAQGPARGKQRAKRGGGLSGESRRPTWLCEVEMARLRDRGLRGSVQTMGVASVAAGKRATGCAWYPDTRYDIIEPW